MGVSGVVGVIGCLALVVGYVGANTCRGDVFRTRYHHTGRHLLQFQHPVRRAKGKYTDRRVRLLWKARLMTTTGNSSGSRFRHRKAAQIAALLAAPLSFLVSAPAHAEAPPGDPPGNNGALKIIAGDLSEPDPDNEPQIEGCLVWLQFFGYDLNQQATITFQVVPPTGEGQLLSHTAGISDDPAGGGQDEDATLSYFDLKKSPGPSRAFP